MQVPYEIKDAKWGKGVFATAPIAKGTVIWRLVDANVVVVPEDKAREYVAKVEAESVKAIEEFLNLSYWMDESLVDIRNDDGRFFNHDVKAQNVGYCEGMMEDGGGQGASAATYALKDIAPGEEMLDDYNTYDDGPEWYTEICVKYNIPLDYLEG